MKVENINGEDYRLPSGLNEFQRQLYVHLIKWKWAHITHAPGYYKYRGRQIPYDAILPTNMIAELRIIYPSVVDELSRHRGLNDFRLHTHFNHMASSQAANVNLFLPILQHPLGSKVLTLLKPDFASLATEHLDHGYCLEYWGGNFRSDNADRGPLGDKSGSHGTDSDLAIAYHNFDGELCLWLIEHKLSEKEFTPCSGPKSDNRNQARHNCSNTFAEILKNKHTCFHHDYGRRKYWDITEANQSFFSGHTQYMRCPFQGGMNQLWRNQLLAFSIERDSKYPFQHAYFSVVHHPKNTALDTTLNAYKSLVGNNPKFFAFTSKDVLDAATSQADTELQIWADWYKGLYYI